MKQTKRILVSLLLIVTLNMITVYTPITHQNQVEAASMQLNETKTSIYVGKKYNLKVSGTSSKVKWVTTNKTIATVSPKGVVTGIKSGRAKITATIGPKKLYCNITVKDKKLIPEDIYVKCSGATVQINTDYGLGSGFFIDQGKVVTNYHVIEGCANIKVQMVNGKSYQVESILGYSKELDIAILKVSTKNKVLKMNQHGIKPGEAVYTIGSSEGFSYTFTNGIVTSMNRFINNVSYIQTNAAISSGNSGGPLLNSYGEVMGINTMEYLGGQNLNFAIDIKQLKKIDTSKSLTVLEFWKRNIADYVTTYLLEEDSKSFDIKTCQEFKLEDTVFGTAKPKERDYYRFTVDKYSKVNFAGMLYPMLKGDEKSITFHILDENGSPVSGYTMEYDDYYLGYNAKVFLTAGTYYISVESSDVYTGYEIPYVFFLNAYEDEED